MASNYWARAVRQAMISIVMDEMKYMGYANSAQSAERCIAQYFWQMQTNGSLNRAGVRRSIKQFYGDL